MQILSGVGAPLFTIPVLEDWTWPWSNGTLHLAYLVSGLVISAYYLPLFKRAWRYPIATADAQCLITWTVWTVCRAVAFIYGTFILHDLIFLVVVGTDLLGRFVLATLIVRARAIAANQALLEVMVPPAREPS